jgi:uncharacterized protein (DUF488 family)
MTKSHPTKSSGKPSVLAPRRPLRLPQQHPDAIGNHLSTLRMHLRVWPLRENSIRFLKDFPSNLFARKLYLSDKKMEHLIEIQNLVMDINNLDIPNNFEKYSEILITISEHTKKINK